MHCEFCTISIAESNGKDEERPPFIVLLALLQGLDCVWSVVTSKGYLDSTIVNKRFQPILKHLSAG